MTTFYTFQIRVIKNQIAACLREIAKGVKYFIDSLVVLEGQLEKLEAKVKMLKINWWGKDHPTALPKSFTGVIVFRLRGVGSVLGFKMPYELKDEIKDFVNARGGTWDGLTKTWWVKASKPQEIGSILTAARNDFSNLIPQLDLAVDPEMGSAVISGFEKWVEKQ